MVSKHLVLDLTAHGPAPVHHPDVLVSTILDGLSARRVASRSATTTPCSFASSKMGTCFGADSPGESDAMLLADVLEDVASFLPQPAEVRFFDGERHRSAFPDLGVVLLGGHVELWEVKGATKDARLARRLGHLSVALATVGIRYRVLTSAWLGRCPLRANARELHRHARRPLSPSGVDALSRLVASHARPTFGLLRTELGMGWADLAAAAAQGIIAIDIEGAPMGEGTSVRLPRPGARSGGYILQGAQG